MCPTFKPAFYKPLFDYPVLALEQQILDILWQHESATVRELLEWGGLNRPYTSVQTAVGRLLKKGLAKRVGEGRVFRYSAACSKEQIQMAMAHDAFHQLLDLNPGNSAALSHLVESVSDTAALDELERLVKQKRAEMQNKP